MMVPLGRSGAVAAAAARVIEHVIDKCGSQVHDYDLRAPLAKQHFRQFAASKPL
jgi:hypothetical protein